MYVFIYSFIFIFIITSPGLSMPLAVELGDGSEAWCTMISPVRRTDRWRCAASLQASSNCCSREACRSVDASRSRLEARGLRSCVDVIRPAKTGVCHRVPLSVISVVVFQFQLQLWFFSYSYSYCFSVSFLFQLVILHKICISAWK